MARRSGFGAVSKGIKFGIIGIILVVAIIFVVVMFSGSSKPPAVKKIVPTPPVKKSEPVPTPPVKKSEPVPVPPVKKGVADSAAPVKKSEPSRNSAPAAPKPIGQGISAGNQLYSSSAWELLKTGEPRTIASSFSDPLYLTWVGRAYEIIKNKYPAATSFTVWKDAGYRIYSGTATPLKYTTDTFMQTFTYP
jgi:hypothetical protein